MGCAGSHVLAGITWIGLLYYFNVGLVPACAGGHEARPRNTCINVPLTGPRGGAAELRQPPGYAGAVALPDESD